MTHLTLLILGAAMGLVLAELTKHLFPRTSPVKQAIIACLAFMVVTLIIIFSIYLIVQQL